MGGPTIVMTNKITLDQAGSESRFNLASLLDVDEDDFPNDSPLQYGRHDCKYYDPDQFHSEVAGIHNPMSFFHLNCRGLSSNWESFRSLICDLHQDDFEFGFIGVSELFRCELDTRVSLPGYHDILTRTRTDDSRGGVGLFVKEHIHFKVREDLSIFIPHVFESIFIEFDSQNVNPSIVGVIYRPNTPPRADVDIFASTMSDICDIINREKKYCVIMGDMNIDLLKFGTHGKTNDYLDNLFSRGYLPLITKPTRLSNVATLIDHIYTNKLSNSIKSGIIITDLADHFGTYCIFAGVNIKRDQCVSKSRSFSPQNMSMFKQLLQGVDFNHILNITCPNEAYNTFISLYKDLFDMAFPLRDVKVHKKYIKREPWITRGLLVSSNIKMKLFRKKITKPTITNLEKYKTYNTMFNKLKRILKKVYFTKLLEDNKDNIKNTWTILKSAISKQQKKSGLTETFCINNESVSDRKKQVEYFNKYFSSIGNNISETVPQSPKHFSEYIPDNLNNSMFLEPINSLYVERIVRKMKPKSSSGHDDVSSKIIIHSIECIGEPIAHIINRSFITGIVPDKLKIAKVVPIFKAGDPQLINNYRPISLLPVFSKIIERAMYDKVVHFLNVNNILYLHQYGFRAKHSTIHPILHLLKYCSDVNNTTPSENTVAIFCDLSKAFDVLDHKILLYKLYRYGIRGTVYEWFKNYLTDRRQYVEIEYAKSSYRHTTCGVPQGSILGPLLYLLYVNDIHKSSSTDNIVTFADDTTLYLSDKNIVCLYRRANVAINKLYDWFCANKLLLNATKTKYIVIRPQHKQLNFDGLNITLRGNSLTQVGTHFQEKSTKFLGIHIDENLTWKHHIINVNKKLSRALFAIKQAKHFLPINCLKILYFSLIHPHLIYGIESWGNASSTTLKKTMLLQKRAVRIINNASYNSHTEPLFKKSGILKFPDLFELQVSIFMYKYENNICPKSFQNMFSFNYEMQTVVLTRQSHLMHIGHSKSKFCDNLPSFSFPRIRNKWMSVVPATVSLASFKIKLRSLLLDTYLSVVKCSNSYCRDCKRN